VKATIEQRAYEWMHGIDVDRGVSSETIWWLMMGHPRPAHFTISGYPHDPSDFGRCHKLLKAIPEWKPRLHEVADHYKDSMPEWGRLIAHWPELTRLYVAEFRRKDRMAPKLYTRMRELIDA